MKLSLQRIPAQIKAVFRPSALDSELDEELSYHLEELTKEYIARGIKAEEAARQARIKLGGITQLHELHREARGIPWLENFYRDFSYACRSFKRERGFTLIALSIIAIGIGLNATVFSLVNTVLLRPLPFDHSDRLVWIMNGSSTTAGHDLSSSAHLVDTWEGLQQMSQSLDRIEAYNPFTVRLTRRLTDGSKPETILSIDVSHGLLGMLGIKPILGRSFLPEDALRNAPDRVMLSNQLWRRHFNADPNIVGKAVQISGQGVEIIGVLPPADAFTSVFFPTVRVDCFSAIKNDLQRNWGNTVSLIGRTKPGVSIEQVRADLDRSVWQLKKQFPDRGSYNATADRLKDWVSAGLKQPLIFLWLAAGFLLAIVSFNLGGLLLARGATRRKEFSVRCALGAGRSRILRQLLTECFGLVAIGSCFGALLAWGLTRFLSHRTGVEIPLLEHVGLDWLSLAFTIALCLLTVVLCGLLPAWSLARSADVQYALKEDSRGSSGGLNQSRMRGLLVMIEVAFACVLAISAGLMIRSLLNLIQVDLGFQPSRVIAVRVDPPSWPDDIYIQSILDRVRAMPGVEYAGVTDCIPVERDRSWGIEALDSDQPIDIRGAGAHVRLISPGLLTAMGTPIIAGRDFTSADKKGSAMVIIINQSLAKQFWPNGEAVGKQVKADGDRHFTVIAVVRDTRHGGPEMPSGNEMYFSLNQVPDSNSWDLMIRTPLPFSTLQADLQTALHEIDPALPLTEIRSMQSIVDLTLSSRRLLVALVGGFAALALGLAMLGLYGLISYNVVQQTKEIGIRLALGATAAMVCRKIVIQTLSLTLIGLLAGLVGSALSSRAMQSLLFGVTSSDALTFFATAIPLLCLAAVAGFLPARRAARMDPLVALRGE